MQTGQIGLGGLAFILTVVFVALKLTGVIAWSWPIVLLPLIIALALTGIGIIIAFFAIVIGVIFRR